ncbi:MAG: serine hydrolase domain-containing protein [Pseudomonadales bacterium]
MNIHGTVAPGFESVKALYAENMRTLAERNTQLCVYVGEQQVVDLWASAIDDPAFTPDSLVNVFSSGKSLEAIAMAMLVDRGHLSFAARVVDYWPEFAAHGKDALTVADLMRHEAGLAAFDATLQPTDMHPENLRANAVGRVIEEQTQKFRDGADAQREYHAITRGWIANEVFRRAEPDGRTMGQFMLEEVSAKLDVDVFIGLKEAQLARISPVVMLGIGYQFLQGLVPRRLGRKMELNLAQTLAKVWRLSAGLKGGTTRGAPSPMQGMKRLSAFDKDEVCMGEMPSAGSKCTARGLAKLAAVMANGGGLGDQRLLGEAAWQQLHGDPVPRKMMAMQTTFTQGGLATFPHPQPDDGEFDQGLNRGREDYFGWMGLGGSIFQWQPQRKIGFAYVPTSLNVLDIVNERGKAYQAEVVRCVDQLG